MSGQARRGKSHYKEWVVYSCGETDSMNFDELQDLWRMDENGESLGVDEFLTEYSDDSSEKDLRKFREWAEAEQEGALKKKRVDKIDGLLEALKNGPPPGKFPVPGTRLLNPGNMFMDYEVIESLGQGGAGVVFSARTPGGQLVALKEIDLGNLSDGIEERAQKNMGDRRHPHLITIIDRLYVEGRLVIVMECAEQNLEEKLRECQKKGCKGISRDDLLEYMREAAKALDYLADPPDGLKPIVHRDIKPQNLLLMGGSVKVTDFGLATILEETKASHSGQLSFMFAAPEFFHGEAYAQSDQYSLAVTYCYLRGGSSPLKGETPAEFLKSHVYELPDFYMVPSAERTVLGRALSKIPTDRWASCSEFVEKLEEASENPESQNWHRSRKKAKKGDGLIVDPRDAIRYLIAFVFFIVFVLLLYIFLIKE